MPRESTSMTLNQGAKFVFVTDDFKYFKKKLTQKVQLPQVNF